MTRVINVEQAADLPLRRFCCCGSQTEHTARGTKFFSDHLVQHQVSRPEVMGPLACAMDFIDANHRDSSTVLAQILREEPLWRDKENFDLLIFDCSHDGLFDWEALLRIDTGSWHEVWQFAKLVSHERDQWCNYKDETRHELSSELIDQRLSSTSR